MPPDHKTRLLETLWPGLPLGWTDAKPGAVSKEVFTSMFPHALSKASIQLSDVNDLTYNVLFIVSFNVTPTLL